MQLNSPRRSLLELATGTKKNDLVKLAPGVIGHPSRVSKLATCLLNCALTIVTSQCWTTKHLMLFTVLRELLVTTMLAEIFSP